MDLWTEFEGVTIDSAFSLTKLLQSEGRSAFFSTINANGESVLIRIVECHFDEDEILARWRGIQTLGHPNFLRIDRFGQFRIEEDDITAVYAVFERVDANLGQVLERGRLAPADAAQIGLSIASALETLHAHGFVHEHIEPRTIFAVGESVRLRSDCIRETREGEAGLEARRRDVHDLALVLMQVLLGMQRGSFSPRQSILPPPFDEIVRKGMSGEWGLAEIQTALATHKSTKAALPKVAPPKPVPVATQPVQVAAQPVPVAAPIPAAVSGAAPPATPASPRDSTAKPVASQKVAPVEPRAQRPAASANLGAAEGTVFPYPGRLPKLSGWLKSFEDPFHRSIAAGVFLAIVVLFGWLVLHRLFGQGSDTEAHSIPAAAHAAAPPSRGPAAKAETPQSTAALPQGGVSQPASTSPSAAQGRTDWRVVAFTYNHQDQAQKKAASLAQKHPDLRPEVFSPSGKAPWLVTIGGVLEHDAAYAMAHKARSLGLPRDTYAQNYAR